jgi:hypothetical protein
MACKVFELNNEDHPEPSLRYQILFDTLESNVSDKAKALKYNLLDGFPEHFTVDNSGDITVRGNIKDPRHIVNVLNNNIARYFRPNGTTQKFLSAKRVNSDTFKLTINENFFTPTETLAKEAYIPKVEDDAIRDAYRILSPPRIATMEEENVEDTVTKTRKVFTTSPTVAEQVKHLVNTFATAGITVSVDFDDTIDTKGKAKTHADGTVTITLNPMLMTEDTHIHEFSHILIDLLGDDNSLVKQALSMVKGTDLYEQVAEAYPELSEQGLLKETLITAMGIAGAKRQQGKSKLEGAINKFIRAIKNFFGITDDAIETLLDKMFSKRLNALEFTGKLTDEEYSSKVINKKADDLKDLINVTAETLRAQLMRLESLPVKNDQVIVQIKAQLAAFEKISKVEDFIGFVDYMGRMVKLNQESIDYITKFSDETLKNMDESERFRLMNSLYHIGNSIQDFFGGGENSIAAKLQDVILDKKESSRLSTEQEEKLSTMEVKVDDLLKQLGRQAKYYREIGLELQVDLLLGYYNTDINDELQGVIDNIEKNKRIISIEEDEEYYKLKDDLKQKKITPENYTEAMLKLNVKQIKNKMVGRDTLIKELRDAQLDKSKYSTLMDPLIYSRQTSLQLFSSLLKNKLYQAASDTRDVVDELAPAYREYAEYKGSDLNPTTFNDEILDTYTYYIRDEETGKRKPMQLLSFIQPYDVTKFQEAEYQMRKDLKAKYKQPEYGTPEYKEWAKSNEGARFFSEVANWYRTNTTVTEEGVKAVADLDKRIKDLNTKIKAAETSPDLLASYEAYKMDLIQQKARMYDSKNEQYKGVAVRPNSKYANPKYAALMANPNSPATKYYNALLKVFHDHQKFCGSQIPLKNDWDTLSYVLPSNEAQGLEKLQSDNYNVFKSTKDFANREFSFLSTDSSYGSVINANKEQRNKLVPIFFITPTDARFVSRDVGSTIVLFAGMANTFRRKSEILGSVIMMRDLVEQREVLEANVHGNPILSTAAKMQGVNRPTRKAGVSNNFQHLMEVIDRDFFGETELKEEINVLGKVLSANKVVNKLATFSALNTLALNALQATNQFLIDNEKLTEEAVAGQYFNTKNLAYAKSTYVKAIFSGEGISDSGKYNKDTKLSRFTQEFDLLGTELGAFAEKRTGNRALKAIDTNSLFALQHLAEHETAVTRGLALADTYKGKLKDKDGNVIKNADGSEANLYDVFIKDDKGKWRIDPKVANFKPIQMINKVSGLYKKTNQIKTSLDDPILNRRWYGKALLMYRRYFQPGLRRRFGHGHGIHVDTEVEGISEGMYWSFLRYMKESFKKGAKFGSVYQVLTPMEKANVKRTSIEAGLTISLTAIGAILAGMMTDDDEEDDYAAAFAAYQAMRISSELSQFYNLKEFYRFASSPTALDKPFINSIELIWHLGTKELPYRLGLRDEDGIYYERKTGAYDKGDLKLTKLFRDVAPILRGIDKTTNPEDALKFFIAPPGAV